MPSGKSSETMPSSWLGSKCAWSKAANSPIAIFKGGRGRQRIGHKSVNGFPHRGNRHVFACFSRSHCSFISRVQLANLLLHDNAISCNNIHRTSHPSRCPCNTVSSRLNYFHRHRLIANYSSVFACGKNSPPGIQPRTTRAWLLTVAADGERGDFS